MSNMETVTLNKLFNYKRFPTGLQLFIVLIYFPIGICLALVRFFIGLHVYLISCFLPKTSILRRLIVRSMCAMLGIVVVQEGCENYDDNCKVLVANYTTKFDYVPLQLVIPHHMVSIWNFSELVTKMLGYLDMGAQFGRETLIANAKQNIENSSIPLLSFPEGSTTNGKSGLLKFSVWPFSLDSPVQPIVIKISRPIFHITPSLADSRLAVDWFWLLFVPLTIFKLNYLPVQPIMDDEEASEFSKGVQRIMAKKLDVQATNYTCNDKLELIKRMSVDKNFPVNESKVKRCSSSQRMAELVKNVLPHVPDSIIENDLAMTKDVDLTISNILEGRTSYNGEESIKDKSVPIRSQVKLSPSTSSPSKNANRSSTFGKSTHERHLSLQDRKKLMIEEAKLRFLAKFGNTE